MVTSQGCLELHDLLILRAQLLALFCDLLVLRVQLLALFLDLLIFRVQLLVLRLDLPPAGGKLAIMLFPRRVPGLRARIQQAQLRLRIQPPRGLQHGAAPQRARLPGPVQPHRSRLRGDFRIPGPD